MKLSPTGGNCADLLVRMTAAIIFAGVVAGANAGTSSANLTVSATYVSANAPTSPGFCTLGPNRSAFGAVVTVVCGSDTVVDIRAPKTATSWTALHGGAYRYAHIKDFELGNPGGLDGIESYTGVGTVTSWRMVSLADRKYLELQIGW